jgi:iron complex transport system substrate-binding protein
MIARRTLLASTLAATTARAEPPRRIVCVGGAVTECAFALGAGAQVVAVDSTSLFPAPVRALPQIGYLRALAPEGLIALRADALLLSEEAGPPQAIAVLRAAGGRLVTIPEQPSGAGVLRKIGAVAAALGVDGAGLAATVGADWALLDAPVASLPPLRAIFVLSAARGAPLVAGENTQAGAMLAACGAPNAIAGFQGYRPLSAEAAAQIAPDVVVMMDHALAEAGGIDAVLRIPALAVTPVARTRRLVAIEGSYALGFGPRAAHARADLTRLLHPGATLPALPRRAWT